MEKKVFPKLCLLILLLPLVSLMGCSTAKSVYQFGTDTAKSVSDTIIPEQKAKLGKRVMVVPIENNAGIKEDKINEITNTWVNYLKRDDRLLISLINRTKPSESEKSSTEYGITISPGLVKQAGESDIDILITAIINPFDVKVRKKGIWPFRKLKKEVTISMDVNVLNISNGALVLSQSENRRFNVESEILDEDDTTWDIDNDILDEELFDIMDSHSDLISDELESQLWTGKITSAKNRTIMINGGQDIGISKGDVFEVFVKGESIRAVNGKDYYIIGEKIGEIRADQVMQKYSMAVPLDDEIYEEGQLIRLKR